MIKCFGFANCVFFQTEIILIILRKSFIEHVIESHFLVNYEQPRRPTFGRLFHVLILIQYMRRFLETYLSWGVLFQPFLFGNHSTCLIQTNAKYRLIMQYGWKWVRSSKRCYQLNVTSLCSDFSNEPRMYKKFSSSFYLSITYKLYVE